MRHLLGSPLHFHNPDPKISCNPVLRRVLSITKIPPRFCFKIPNFEFQKIQDSEKPNGYSNLSSIPNVGQMKQLRIHISMTISSFVNRKFVDTNT